MTTAALIVAALALVLAYMAWSRNQATGRGLAALQDQVQQLRGELSENNAALQGRLDELCREAQRQAGQLRFVPGMTIAEALRVHPAAAMVLADYQLGGCSSCAVSDVDTLEGACRSYGIDQEGLMAALNRLVGLSASPEFDKPIKISGAHVDL